MYKLIGFIIIGVGIALLAPVFYLLAIGAAIGFVCWFLYEAWKDDKSND